MEDKKNQNLQVLFAEIGFSFLQHGSGDLLLPMTLNCQFWEDISKMRKRDEDISEMRQ